MWRIARLLVCSFVIATGAFAQSRDDITGVIQNQLDAFQADDFATAFTFASPMIRSMFGSHDRFGAMVKQGYPMVHRPAGVEYLDQIPRDGRTYQTVQIVDQRGDLHYLEYEMIPTDSGWQINGVRFVRPPDLGA